MYRRRWSDRARFFPSFLQRFQSARDIDLELSARMGPDSLPSRAMKRGRWSVPSFLFFLRGRSGCKRYLREAPPPSLLWHSPSHGSGRHDLFCFVSPDENSRNAYSLCASACPHPPSPVSRLHGDAGFPSLFCQRKLEKMTYREERRRRWPSPFLFLPLGGAWGSKGIILFSPSFLNARTTMAKGIAPFSSFESGQGEENLTWPFSFFVAILRT